MINEIHIVLLLIWIVGISPFIVMFTFVGNCEKKKQSAIEMSDDEFDKSMNCGGTPDILPCEDKTCVHYGLCSAITGRKK